MQGMLSCFHHISHLFLFDTSTTLQFERETFVRWMSLGNQLEGVRLVDDGLRARFKAAYPDVQVQPSSPPKASAMEIDSNASQSRSPFAEPRSSTPQFTDITAAATEVTTAYAAEDRTMAVDADVPN